MFSSSRKKVAEGQALNDILDLGGCQQPAGEVLSLSEHFLYNMSVYVGESSLDAVVPEGERFVIEAKKMENGGVEIVD